MSKQALLPTPSLLSFFCSGAMATPSSDPSVSSVEVARFSAQAQAWWTPRGPFRALHELGPMRLAYIQEQIAATFGPPASKELPLAGLRVLDVGCGGGLMAEPLARAGATVVGLDASGEVLAVARAHAAANQIAIDYREGSAEALAATAERFDVITALEIVEHVADLDSFMRALAQLLRPGGLLIVATLNRTKRSFLLAVVAAEYVLGWVPTGTHEWEKFVKPSELAVLWAKNGLTACDCTGFVFQPLRGGFALAKGRAGVNYFMTGKKEKTQG